MNKKLLVPFLLSILASCAARPDPADVAADRARYTFIDAAFADGQLDAGERLVWSGDENTPGLGAAWDLALRHQEELAAKPMLESLLSAYGVAALNTFLVPELRDKAPALLALIDRNTNGFLEEAELLAFDATDPVFAMLVMATAAALLR